MSFNPQTIRQWILPPVAGRDGTVWQYRITKNATRPCFDVAGRFGAQYVFALDHNFMIFANRPVTRSRVNDQDGDLVCDGFDLELRDYIFFSGTSNSVAISTDPASPNYGGYNTSANYTSLLNLIFAQSDFIWFIHKQNLTTGEILPPYIVQPNGITASDRIVAAPDSSTEQTLSINRVHVQGYSIMFQTYLMSDIMYGTANPGRFGGTILGVNYNPANDWYKITNPFYASGAELSVTDMETVNPPSITAAQTWLTAGYPNDYGLCFFCGFVEVAGTAAPGGNGYKNLSPDARNYHWIVTGDESNEGGFGEGNIGSSLTPLNGIALAWQETLPSDHWPNGCFGMELRHFLELLAGTAGMYWDRSTFDCEFDFYAPQFQNPGGVYNPLQVAFNGLQAARESSVTAIEPIIDFNVLFGFLQISPPLPDHGAGVFATLSISGNPQSGGFGISWAGQTAGGAPTLCATGPGGGPAAGTVLELAGNIFPGSTGAAGTKPYYWWGYSGTGTGITASQIQTALQTIANTSSFIASYGGVTVTCAGGPLASPISHVTNYDTPPITISLTKGGQPYFPNLPMTIVNSTVRDGGYYQSAWFWDNATDINTTGNNPNGNPSTSTVVSIVNYPNQYTNWPITWNYNIKISEVLKLLMFQTGSLFYTDVFQIETTINGFTYYPGDPILRTQRRRTLGSNLPSKANGGTWSLGKSSMEQTYIAKTHVEVSNVADNTVVASPTPPLTNQNPYQIKLPFRGHVWAGPDQLYSDNSPMILDALSWDTSLDRDFNYQRFQVATEYDGYLQLWDGNFPNDSTRYPNDNALNWCPNPNPNGWMPGALLYVKITNAQLFNETGPIGTDAMPNDMASHQYPPAGYVSGNVTGYVSLLGCCNQTDTFNPKLHSNTLYAPAQFYAQELLQNRIMVRRRFTGCSQNFSTTVTTGAKSATQTLTSTAGMSAGDALYFATANAWRTISSVTSGTVVVLTASVNSTTGETVTDRNYRVVRERMQDSFMYRGAVTNFKVIDCSVNELENWTEVLEMQYFTPAEYVANLPAVSTIGGGGGGATTGGSSVGGVTGGGSSSSGSSSSQTSQSDYKSIQGNLKLYSGGSLVKTIEATIYGFTDSVQGGFVAQFADVPETSTNDVSAQQMGMKLRLRLAQYQGERGNVAIDACSNCALVQTLVINGSPTGGTFQLIWNNQITAAIPYNATASQVQTALRALTNMDTYVSVSLASGVYTITFSGQLSGTNVNIITANSSGLTGGTSPFVQATVASWTSGPTYFCSGDALVAEGESAGNRFYTELKFTGVKTILASSFSARRSIPPPTAGYM